MSDPKMVNLKVGGSMLSKSDDLLFDFGYANKLKYFLAEMIAKGYKFTINVGGGYVTRKYQHILERHQEHDEMDLHRVGVAATNLNAEILRGLLDDVAYPEVISYGNYDKFLKAPKSEVQNYFDKFAVLVIAASKPGTSNDNNALDACLQTDGAQVISLKNVAGVFTADPVKHPDAKMVNKLTWTEYLNIIGNPDHHEPGASYPVDVFTAHRAQDLGIRFVVVSGEHLDNLKNLIEGGEFKGSTIEHR